MNHKMRHTLSPFSWKAAHLSRLSGVILPHDLEQDTDALGIPSSLREKGILHKPKPQDHSQDDKDKMLVPRNHQGAEIKYREIHKNSQPGEHIMKTRDGETLKGNQR